MAADDVHDQDPRAELARLAGAIAHEVKRRRWLGARSERRPARLADGAAAQRPQPQSAIRIATRPPAAPAGQAGLPPRPARAPEPAQTPSPTAPRPIAARAPVSSALATAEGKASEIRELARGAADLGELARLVAGCTACGLCRTRTQTVFADGRARVPVMFVGEAPGEQEDLQGLPFVGRAGQLLTDIITKGMRLDRADVYIANVLKCRPPDNRDPTEVEKLLCTPWLDRQIELVDPKVIIPLGRHAAMHVLKVEASMSSLRGRVHPLGSRKVVPTYHPAYLLRDPSKKAECWKDIQLAMAELGLALPPRPSAPES